MYPCGVHFFSPDGLPFKQWYIHPPVPDLTRG